MESSLSRCVLPSTTRQQPAGHTTPQGSVQESLNTDIHTLRSRSLTHAHRSHCNHPFHALRIIAHAWILHPHSPHSRAVTFRPTTPGHTAEPDSLAPWHHTTGPSQKPYQAVRQHRHCRPYAKPQTITSTSLGPLSPRCRTYPGINGSSPPRHTSPSLHTALASRWLAVRQGLCRLP